MVFPTAGLVNLATLLVPKDVEMFPGGMERPMLGITALGSL